MINREIFDEVRGLEESDSDEEEQPPMVYISDLGPKIDIDERFNKLKNDEKVAKKEEKKDDSDESITITTAEPEEEETDETNQNSEEDA